MKLTEKYGPEFVIAIGPHFKRAYRLINTTAPRAYDYGYVLELYDGGEQRVVAIPDDYVDYQVARYESGLYQWLRLETWEFEAMCETTPDLFYEALTNRNPVVNSRG